MYFRAIEDSKPGENNYENILDYATMYECKFVEGYNFFDVSTINNL